MFNKNHTNSRNDYTEDDIIKMMEFLIDIIFIVFGDMMLQHTIYNRKYNWNKQNCSPLLTGYNNRVLSLSMTYQQILARVTQHDGSNSGAWTSYQIGTIELTLVFRGVCIAQSLVFCEVFMLDNYQLLPKKGLSFGSNWKRWKRIPEFLSVTHGNVTLNMWSTITGKMISQ